MAVTRTSHELRDVESIPLEKDQVVHKEFRQGGLSQHDLDFLDNFPEDRKKAVIRKVDVGISILASRLY